MKGSDFVKSLPKGAGPEREAKLLDAVLNRQIVLSFSPLVIKGPNVQVVYQVSSDVLRFGDLSDSVRLGCGQRTHQLIADELGCVLPTMKLSDEIYRQADLKLPPTPHNDWVNDGTMGNTARMAEQSAIIDKQIAGRPFDLVAGHHKDWVNTAWFGTVMGEGPSVMTCGKETSVPNPKGGKASCNYGWHYAGGAHPSQTLPGVSVWQGPGHCHNMEHADYSQFIRLVGRTVLVCSPAAISGLGATTGSPCQLPDGSAGLISEVDIYTMPDREGLKGYLGHEGGSWLMRHPMVPWPGGGEPLPFVPSSPPGDYGTGSAGPSTLQKILAVGLGAACGWYGVRLLEKLADRGHFSA